MGVDLSAVASVLGISTNYIDTRAGNVAVLPQRIAIFGQGSTGVTYPATKWQSPNAAATGAVHGYTNPLYLAHKELSPIDGDGVGSIPVTIYPLTDAAGATAAVGDITPSGTATDAGTYYARVSGIPGNAFSIPKGAVDVTATIAKLGSSIGAVLGMPVTVAYAYGTVTASAISGTGNGTLTSLVAHAGSTPLPGAYQLVCTTVVTNGGVFTLTDPNGTVISSGLTITAGAGGTCVASNVGGLDFTITDGTTDFGLNASFTITVPATKVTVTSGWKGISANDIRIEIVGPLLGVVFAITQPTGGTVNPTVDSALAQVGGVWETMALNCLNVSDTTALDTYQTFGEARWGTTSKKPLVVFSGSTASAVGTAVTIPNSRPTDRVNSQLVAPGSPNLPFAVAARQLSRIAVVANNNPPTDYCAQSVNGIVPGTDAVQWLWASRDLAIKAGSSTVEVVDGVIRIGDVVTFYHPTGETPPAYRDVVDIVRAQNIIFNIGLIFASKEWAAAPLIPDDQVTVNPNARRPKDARIASAVMVDALGLQAILSNPDVTRKSITAVINSSNNKRLDVTIPVQFSGNTKIKSIDLNWSFYFGTAA